MKKEDCIIGKEDCIIGTRVAVYQSGVRNTGVIVKTYLPEDGGVYEDVQVDLEDELDIVLVHRNQCRKLVKKKTREFTGTWYEVFTWDGGGIVRFHTDAETAQELCGKRGMTFREVKK